MHVEVISWHQVSLLITLYIPSEARSLTDTQTHCIDNQLAPGTLSPLAEWGDYHASEVFKWVLRIPAIPSCLHFYY